MIIRIKQPYDIPVFKGFDDNGDSLYPTNQDLLGDVHIKTINGPIIFLNDGRHILLNGSEYLIVKTYNLYWSDPVSDAAGDYSFDTEAEAKDKAWEILKRGLEVQLTSWRDFK